jgi:hypothetical protein
MPLEYRIDHERRTVFATATKRLSDDDIFAYQRKVWAGGEFMGYDEVVDLSPAEDLVLSSEDRIRELAELATSMEAHGAPSKVAIVAPRDLAYGFARMFETYRTMGPGVQKRVSVFRSLPEAMEWLTDGGPVRAAAGDAAAQR